MDPNYASAVAGTIIEQLQTRTSALVRPCSPGERFLPYNPTTGRTYRGANVIWLAAAAQARGFSDMRWMTSRQAQSVGAHVRAGERGSTIQYWKWREERQPRNADGSPVLGEDGGPQRQLVGLSQPQVWSAVVFNADQIEGMPAPEARPTFPERERHEIAEAIIAGVGATIRHVPGDQAFYMPQRDEITLPERARFPAADAFYAVMIHEVGHASGHPDRLNRDLSHPFLSEGYAREELRGAIASLIMGSELGIGYDPRQHVAYIGSWIKILQDDPREILRATADAERIVRYLSALAPTLQQEAAHGSLASAKAVISEPARIEMSGASAPTYLSVPYQDRLEAKQLGAKWDKAARLWYVPEGVSSEPFAKWQANVRQTESGDPREAFADILKAAGLRLDGSPEMDGRLHRGPVEGDKRGERSGAYTGYLDGTPAGFVQNFKTGERFNWKFERQGHLLTAAERARLKHEAKAKADERKAARVAIHNVTLALITGLIEGAAPAPSSHPYLARKGVGPHGALLNRTGPIEILGGEVKPQNFSARGNLLIPIHDVAGERLRGVQSIAPDGKKSFPRGGLIAGAAHHMGERHDIAKHGIILAEGFATGATIHELTGLPVAVTFTSNNLEAVARAFRKQFPDAPIYIAGDNDHRRESEIDARGRPKKNAGRSGAETAARAVGGVIVLPSFAADDPGSDWNDIRTRQGTDECRKQFRDAFRSARELLHEMAELQRQEARNPIGAREATELSPERGKRAAQR